MQAQNLDLRAMASKVNTFTMSVQDYSMASETVAKVMLTVSNLDGKSPEQIRTAISAAFNNVASAVEDSFLVQERQGTISTIVGFVAQNAEVRDPEDEEVKSGMKVMASNLLMDNADKSLWETRKGAAGSYLVRQGEEDLSELIHLAKAHKTGFPTFAATAGFETEEREFASFVDLASAEVAHGYIVANDDEKGTVTIMAIGADAEVVVSKLLLINVVAMEKDEATGKLEDEAAIGVTMAETAAIGNDKAGMKEYYKQAYSYAPEYYEMIVRQIDGLSIA